MRCGPYPLRLHMRVIPMSVEGSVRSLALLLVLYASAAHAASATANVFTCPISPGTQITVPVGIRLGSIPLASYVVDVGYYPPAIAPRSRDARPPQRGVGRHRLRHDHALVLKHGCSHRDGRPPVLIFARADRAQNRITVLNLTAKTTRAQLRLQRR